MDAIPPKAEIDVHYVAQLARLHLSGEETRRFQSQLAQVLSYVEQLGELDLEGIEPTAHAVARANAEREDEPGFSLTVDEALANAPSQANGLFMAPKVVE